MWDDEEGGDRRAGIGAVLSGWALWATIMLGVAVWSGAQLLMFDAGERSTIAQSEGSTGDSGTQSATRPSDIRE